MREIRFRFWDKVDNMMMSDISTWTDDYTDMLNETIEHKQDDLVIMQYTGMRDKERVAIYEGDVVKFADYDTGGGLSYFTGEVIFEEFAWHITNAVTESQLSRYNWEEIEVIGNIYEDKELLEERG